MRVVDEETRKLVMKQRLDALEGDRLFDELNYGVDNFEANDDNNAEAQDDWAEGEQDLQSDEEDHEISSEDEQANDEDKNLEDDPENIWGSSKQKSLRDPKQGVGANKNDNKRKTRV
jgi:hypothetical protein